MNAPLAAGLALLVGVVAVQLARVLAATGGEFAYPLDDAYIHLAMARHLADSGVYGVTPHAFASASSSPAWLLLLATARTLGGTAEWLPVALATSCAAALLFAVDGWWRRSGVGGGVRACGHAALVFGGALPTLSLSGMEHCLHAWLVVLFAAQVVAAIGAADTAAARGPIAAAIALAPLVVAARYESLFLVLPAGLLLWRARGWPAMVLLGAAAALPVAALGLWSLAHGHFVLPTSVLLKSSAVPIPGINPASHGIWTGVRTLTRYGHVGALLVVAAAVWWWSRRRSGGHPGRNALVLFAVALALHAQFARVGWYFRYEAWLLALGAAVVVPGLAAMAAAGRRPRLATVGLLLLLAGAFAGRSGRALRDPPLASRHTLLQNVQVGRFVASLSGERRVAINDIGAVNWLADVHLLDLVGLADVEVARARRTGAFDAGFVAELAARRGTTLAVVYADWFPGQLPAHWQRLGAWTVEQPYWGPTVTFYAVDPAAADALRAALAAFRPRLPPGVRVE